MTSEWGWDATMAALKEELNEEFLSSKLFIYAEEISREWENICFQFSLRLPRPAFAISESRTALGHWDSFSQTLSISRFAVEELSWDSVLGVLKHEMAHQLVQEWGLDHETDHGEAFRKASDRLGLLDPFRTSRVSLDYMHENSVRKSAPQSIIERRIERLAALAHSSNIYEADLAIEKLKSLRESARELIPSNGGRPVDFAKRTLSLGKKRISREESLAASILSRHYGVEVIHSDEFSAKRMERVKTIVLLGRSSLVDMAEFVFHFLLQESARSWEKHRRSSLFSATERSSFQSGVLMGFDSALKKSSKAEAPCRTRHLESPARPEAMIPKAEKGALKDFVHSQFPRLVRRNSSRSRVSESAHQAGREVGKKIVLPDPIKGTTGKGPRSLPASR